MPLIRRGVYLSLTMLPHRPPAKLERSMSAFQLENAKPERQSKETMKEDKVDPMWSAEEDDRRVAIARRAAAGARKALALA